MPAILGGLIAAQVALVAFAKIDMEDRVLGMPWAQFHLAVAFHVLVMMLAFLVRDPGFGVAEVDRGIGMILMLIAAIGLVVGAVMRRRESAPAF